MQTLEEFFSSGLKIGTPSWKNAMQRVLDGSLVLSGTQVKYRFTNDRITNVIRSIATSDSLLNLNANINFWRDVAPLLSSCLRRMELVDRDIDDSSREKLFKFLETKFAETSPPPSSPITSYSYSSHRAADQKDAIAIVPYPQDSSPLKIITLSPEDGEFHQTAHEALEQRKSAQMLLLKNVIATQGNKLEITDENELFSLLEQKHLQNLSPKTHANQVANFPIRSYEIKKNDKNIAITPKADNIVVPSFFLFPKRDQQCYEKASEELEGRDRQLQGMIGSCNLPRQVLQEFQTLVTASSAGIVSAIPAFSAGMKRVNPRFRDRSLDDIPRDARSLRETYESSECQQDDPAKWGAAASNLGMLLCKNEHLRQGIAIFEQAYASDAFRKADPQAWGLCAYRLGHFLHRDKQYDKALKPLQSSLEIIDLHVKMPNVSRSAIYYLTECFKNTKDFEKGNLFFESLTSRSDFPHQSKQEVSLWHGNYLYINQKYEKSAKVLQDFISSTQAESMDPCMRAISLFQLGESRMNIGQHDAAIQAIQESQGGSEIHRILPKLHQSAYLNLNICFWETKKWNEGASYFQSQASRSDLPPENKVCAQVYHANMLCIDSKFDEASQILQQVNDSAQAACLTSSTRGVAISQLGHCRFKFKQYGAAAKTFQTLVQEPEYYQTIPKLCDDALDQIHNSFTMNGNHQEAIATFQSFVARGDISSESKMRAETWHALHLYNGQEHDKAFAIFKRIHDSADARNLSRFLWARNAFQLGYCFIQKKRYQDAIDTLKEGIAISESHQQNSPIFLSAFQNLRHSYAQSRQYTEGAAFFTSLATRNDLPAFSKIEASYSAGEMFYLGQKDSEAIQTFQQLRNSLDKNLLSPDKQALAACYLGSCLSQQHRYNAAIAPLQEGLDALTLQKQQISTQSSTFASLEHCLQHDHTLSLFRSSPATNAPSQAQTKALQGAHHFLKKQYLLAISPLREACNSAHLSPPSQARTQAYFGSTLFYENAWKDAIPPLQAAITSDLLPNALKPIVQANLGGALLQDGQIDPAVQYLNQAWNAGAQSHVEDLALNYGKALCLQNKYVEALPILEKANQMPNVQAKKKAQIEAYLGKSLLENGQRARAKKLLSSAQSQSSLLSNELRQQVNADLLRSALPQAQATPPPQNGAFAFALAYHPAPPGNSRTPSSASRRTRNRGR